MQGLGAWRSRAQLHELLQIVKRSLAIESAGRGEETCARPVTPDVDTGCGSGAHHNENRSDFVGRLHSLLSRHRSEPTSTCPSRMAAMRSRTPARAPAVRAPVA